MNWPTVCRAWTASALKIIRDSIPGLFLRTGFCGAVKPSCMHATSGSWSLQANGQHSMEQGPCTDFWSRLQGIVVKRYKQATGNRNRKKCNALEAWDLVAILALKRVACNQKIVWVNLANMQKGVYMKHINWWENYVECIMRMGIQIHPDAQHVQLLPTLWGTPILPTDWSLWELDSTHASMWHVTLVFSLSFLEFSQRCSVLADKCVATLMQLQVRSYKTQTNQTSTDAEALPRTG